MNATCQNCRWWDNTYPVDGAGMCTIALTSDGIRTPGTKAWAEDSSEYYAGLRTMPDFGCTQWTCPPPPIHVIPSLARVYTHQTISWPSPQVMPTAPDNIYRYKTCLERGVKRVAYDRIVPITVAGDVVACQIIPVEVPGVELRPWHRHPDDPLHQWYRYWWDEQRRRLRDAVVIPSREYLPTVWKVTEDRYGYVEVWASFSYLYLEPPTVADPPDYALTIDAPPASVWEPAEEYLRRSHSP